MTQREWEIDTSKGFVGPTSSPSEARPPGTEPVTGVKAISAEKLARVRSAPTSQVLDLNRSEILALLDAYEQLAALRSSPPTATIDDDTEDWPQRFAVYAYSVGGFDELTKEEQQVCNDAATWARDRVAEAVARLTAKYEQVVRERDGYRESWESVREDGSVVATLTAEVASLREDALTPEEAAALVRAVKGADVVFDIDEEARDFGNGLLKLYRLIASRTSTENENG